jgi:putative transposase
MCWSSYGYNALGQTDALVNPHPEYRRLGQTDEECRSAYQQLFEYPVSEESIKAIREATNKAWVLGNDRFKQDIQEKLKRRVEPAAKGGDRRSEQFKINRV